VEALTERFATKLKAFNETLEPDKQVLLATALGRGTSAGGQADDTVGHHPVAYFLLAWAANKALDWALGDGWIGPMMKEGQDRYNNS
jgi:hypothetical protein